MPFTPTHESIQASRPNDGFALPKFIEAIVELPRRHSRFDTKPAYWQVHQYAAALTSCVSTQGLQQAEDAILPLLGPRMTSVPPTIAYRSDTCEHVLISFSLETGRA